MRLIAIAGLILLTGCSQTSDGDSTISPNSGDASILIAIGPNDEIWLREDMPDQLRGGIPIDEQNFSSIDASIAIDPEIIPDIVLPLDVSANSLLPIYCGGRMENGMIVNSSCFLGMPTSPNWIEVGGEIVIGEGNELAIGHVFCMSFVRGGRESNAACKRYDYM